MPNKCIECLRLGPEGASFSGGLPHEADAGAAAGVVSSVRPSPVRPACLNASECNFLPKSCESTKSQAGGRTAVPFAFLTCFP